VSEHKIRVPFLVLTVERRVKFLAWARKGFRSCFMPDTTRSSRSDAASTIPTAGLEKAITTQSAVPPSKPVNETAAATQSIVPAAASRLQNVSRSLASARKNGTGSTRRLVPNGRLLMPGERRNGHCMTCTCADCRKLVEADAERYFKRSLGE